MPAQGGSLTPTVLVLGGTGRTGRRVLGELLRRGCAVRAIVRSTTTLGDVVNHPALTLVNGSVLSLGAHELRQVVRGCNAVVSCLGHTISFKGILGPPYGLVSGAARRVCAAIRANRPAAPVRLIVMCSVSVNHPGQSESRRSAFERLFLALLCVVLPPAGDNQRAANFLHRRVGTADPFIEWVGVRPDTLREGEISEYTLHKHLVSGVFNPASTRMANVAHFMADLATDGAIWSHWKGKFPVIVNSTAGG